MCVVLVCLELSLNMALETWFTPTLCHDMLPSTVLQLWIYYFFQFKIKDNTLKDIVAHCTSLKTLVIANCPDITDSTLFTIATLLPNLRYAQKMFYCHVRFVYSSKLLRLSQPAFTYLQLTIERSEICSKLTIKTPGRRHFASIIKQI